MALISRPLHTCTSGFPIEEKGIRLESGRQYWTTLITLKVCSGEYVLECVMYRRSSRTSGFESVQLLRLRQFRLCFAGTGREILNSNPFIFGLFNRVPFSLVLSARRVANHVLILSICALSKLRVVFACKKFCFIRRRYGVFYVTFCIFVSQKNQK